MAYTDDIPPPSAPASAGQSGWETCDHCQAPLDERQRYCVACGARRPQADDPAARYFATTARRARSSEQAPVAQPSSGLQGNTKTALLLALLPVVAAIGIFVGRGGDDGNELLLEALKAQKAPVVNVGSGGGGTAEAADDGGSDEKKDDSDGGGDPADGEVIGRGAYGTARKLTGAKATPEQLEESKKALKKIVESKGKEYVEQQRGLPDQIIIP